MQFFTGGDISKLLFSEWSGTAISEHRLSFTDKWMVAFIWASLEDTNDGYENTRREKRDGDGDVARDINKW